MIRVLQVTGMCTEYLLITEMQFCHHCVWACMEMDITHLCVQGCPVSTFCSCGHTQRDASRKRSLRSAMSARIVGSERAAVFCGAVA
jgi:hypothetical protein